MGEREMTMSDVLCLMLYVSCAMTYSNFAYSAEVASMQQLLR